VIRIRQIAGRLPSGLSTIRTESSPSSRMDPVGFALMAPAAVELVESTLQIANTV
jgi:hypothetical protein